MSSEERTSSLLQSHLAGRDVECPVCRYNLRDLKSDRCPECGEQLVLRLTPAEPKQAACIAGLVGLAAGAGFSALLVVFFLLSAVINRNVSGSMYREFLVITGGGFLLEGALLLIWIRSWGRIRRLGPALRWWLVAGCFALSLMNVSAFTAWIR